MDKSKVARSMAENLPELVLKLIFSFLPFEDLLSVRKVCTTWEYMTRNVLAWKHAPLELGHEYYKRNDIYRLNVEDLVGVPYLHTITGCTSNAKELFEALEKNVMDLRKADILIAHDNSFSTVNFQNFVKKFKNLEFLLIDNEIPAVMESLHMLSNLSNLRELHLSCTGNLESIKHMCHDIGDGFSALRKLEIVHVHETKDSINAIFDLLRKKLKQLTELNLNDDFRPYLELISNSTKLEKLRIITLSCLENAMNLRDMTELKSLNLTINHKCSSSLHSPGCIKDVYSNIIFPQNIEYLYIYLYVDPPSAIVSNIINSLPNLKVLYVSNVDDSDINQQLEGINKLPMLHTVIFEDCPTLSLSGVECIMKECKNLRTFKISKMTFTDSTYEVLKNCKYLQDLTLEDCKYNVDKLIPCLASLKYLTNIKLKCWNKDSKGQLFSSDHVISCIMQEHKKAVLKCIGTVLKR